jgi:hypothetical protein
VILVDSNVPMHLVGAAHPQIDRRDAIQPAHDLLLAIVDEVLPIDRASTERAKDIVMGRRRLSARDALHIAVMEGFRAAPVHASAEAPTDPWCPPPRNLRPS